MKKYEDIIYVYIHILYIYLFNKISFCVGIIKSKNIILYYNITILSQLK